MKQADLLANIHRNYHESNYPNRRWNPSRDQPYMRKMMIFRVRMKGIHRARAVGREIRRQMDRRLNPCLRVTYLSLEIVTARAHPLLMWEQIEMASALGRDSPIQQRWGEVREYDRANLKEALEVSVILSVAPNLAPPVQRPDRVK